MELPINTKKINIPDEIIVKWQSIVNILADAIHVLAALIMKVEPPYIEVLHSSESNGNPYKVGDREHLAGLYCETVIATRDKLLVPNALKDPDWDKNPDIKLGMISYLGFPLLWPDGEVFGTICVLDSKENRYSRVYEELLLQFKELVEAHLDLLYQKYKLGGTISERRRAEEALRESEARYRLLVENANDAIYALDSDLRITDVNPFAEQAIGYSRDELVGRSFPELGVLAPASLGPAAEDTARVLAGERVSGAVYEFITKDGQHLLGELSGAPIYREGQVVGVLAIARDITERKRAEELARAQRDLALALGAALGLDEALRLCLETALRISGMDCGGIYLVDDASGALDLVLHKRLPPDFVSSASHYEADSPSAQLVMVGQPVYSEHLRLGVSLDEVRRREALRAIAILPVHHEGRVIACLNVASHTLDEAPAFSRTALEAIAARIGSAIARVQVGETLRERTAQLEALRQVGLKLTAELDLDSLLNSIVSQAIELLGGAAGGLDLYQPERDVLEWTASVGLNSAPSSTVIRRGEGLAGKVWETGEPLIVDDYQHWEGQAAVWEGYPLGGVVGVPVRWGDEFLGVLEVVAEPLRTFSPADAELLSLFATQAAIAIQNARLYEETHSRAERLAVVNRIASAVGAILDLDDLMETVYQEVASIFQADAFFIALYDEGTNELDFRLRVDEGIRESPARRPLETGLTSLVVAEKKPLFIRDLEQERDRLPPLDLWGTMKLSASWLGAPMLIGERLIGVICVQDYRPYVYGEEEELLLSTIADQVAVAIEQAWLYEAEREQRELAESLEKAAAAVSSTLEPDQVLDRILEQVSRVVPNDAANIMLIEGDQARIVRWRGYERFGVEEFVSTVVFHIPEVSNLQQMLESGEPMVIPDTATYPGWVELPVQEWLRSYAAAPIVVRGEVIGFLNVDSAASGFFTQAHAEALRAFAGHAAAAIENARLYEAERRRIAEFEALRQASLHLTSTLELQPILEAILDHALDLVAADDAHVFLYDGERLAFGAALWEDGRQQEPYAEPRPQGLTYTVARSGERIVIPDVNSHLLFRDYQWGGAIVGLPLRIGERVVGVMNVSFQRPHAFDESELRVLELLADQAAIAIENARLYEVVQQELTERKRAEVKLQHTLEKLREALGGIIQIVALTVETRDPYTAGHQRRVSNLACAIANEMGLSQEHIDGIRMAGLIHDLGKIAIPAEILSTPIRLNDFQWGMIKAHPQVGYDILKTIELPWPVAPIVLQHHERLDGSGYPQGLSGDEIMLAARILAVADVVEAMASFRPYRPALGVDKALEEISRNRGLLYDAEVVDTCLMLLTEKGFEFEQADQALHSGPHLLKK